ncbi:type VI secretion system Vgr family protein [Pricia sp.]|uniref:type VI secretion system Vgr family protein n=1 Tax=Pricia sp. TaxID=2268138 RepID=UPI0035949245
MDNAIEFIGKRMSIGLVDGAMEYTGLVTSVDLQKGTGAAGTMVVSGHGPSVLLANSVQCLSYEEGTPLSHVASDTLDGHSGEIVKAVMGAGTDIALPFTVQYNESDLSFLQRLCRKYGLWLYHNGRDYCIGRSGSQQIKGTYGVDVTAFNLSTSLRGSGSEVSGHDWTRDDLLETPSSAFSPKSGHPYFGQVKKESDLAFAKRGRYDHSAGQHEYGRQTGMDTATEVTAIGAAAGMVTATGVSEIVDLRVADILALQGLDFTDASNRHTFGNYDITRIVHSFDHSGHYQNRFEAIPADTDHPPCSDGFAVPFAADQRGRVLDNADPNGLGRVKVQFPWQRQISASTPWIKTSTPYAGSGRGFYFVPEKGEEVLVGFEGGNPEKPYVIGGGFNANAKSGFADSGNNIKAIRTRSGHTIELNDTEGGEMITINDKNGNSIHINTSEGKMVFTAQGDMEFSAKNIRFNVQEDMDVAIGGSKKESIKETYELVTKDSKERVFNNKEIRISKKLEQVSGESLVQTTRGEMLIDSKGKLTLQSKDAVDYGG